MLAMMSVRKNVFARPDLIADAWVDAIVSLELIRIQCADSMVAGTPATTSFNDLNLHYLEESQNFLFLTKSQSFFKYKYLK